MIIHSPSFISISIIRFYFLFSWPLLHWPSKCWSFSTWTRPVRVYIFICITSGKPVFILIKTHLTRIGTTVISGHSRFKDLLLKQSPPYIACLLFPCMFYSQWCLHIRLPVVTSSLYIHTFFFYSLLASFFTTPTLKDHFFLSYLVQIFKTVNIYAMWHFLWSGSSLHL